MKLQKIIHLAFMLMAIDECDMWDWGIDEHSIWVTVTNHHGEADTYVFSLDQKELNNDTKR